MLLLRLPKRAHREPTQRSLRSRVKDLPNPSSQNRRPSPTKPPLQRHTHIHRPSRLRLRQRNLPHLHPAIQNPNPHQHKRKMLPRTDQIRRPKRAGTGIWPLHRQCRERVRLQRAGGPRKHLPESAEEKEDLIKRISLLKAECHGGTF